MIIMPIAMQIQRLKDLSWDWAHLTRPFSMFPSQLQQSSNKDGNVTTHKESLPPKGKPCHTLSLNEIRPFCKIEQHSKNAQHNQNKQNNHTRRPPAKTRQNATWKRIKTRKANTDTSDTSKRWRKSSIQISPVEQINYTTNNQKNNETNKRHR